MKLTKLSFNNEGYFLLFARYEHISGIIIDERFFFSFNKKLFGTTSKTAYQETFYRTKSIFSQNSILIEIESRKVK